MTQKMSPLRRRMIEDMTVRNLSPATQRSYISAVLKFSGRSRSATIAWTLQVSRDEAWSPRRRRG